MNRRGAPGRIWSSGTRRATPRHLAGASGLDSGIRAAGHLLDDDPKIGKRVKIRIGVVRRHAGEETYGLEFVPV